MHVECAERGPPHIAFVHASCFLPQLLFVEKPKKRIEQLPVSQTDIRHKSIKCTLLFVGHYCLHFWCLRFVQEYEHFVNLRRNWLGGDTQDTPSFGRCVKSQRCVKHCTSISRLEIHR